MKLVNKTKRWDYGEMWVGRKKNYEVNINYSSHPLRKENPYWYYTLRKGNYTYNSLWDELKYKSKEECINAVEEKLLNL